MGSLLGILVTLIVVAAVLWIAGEFVGWLGIAIVEFFRRIISRRFEEKIEKPQWVRVPNSEFIRLENAGCAGAFRIDDSYEWEACTEDERGEELCDDDDFECAIDLRSVPRDKPLWIQVPEEDIDRLEKSGCVVSVRDTLCYYEFAVDLRTLPYGVPLCDE